MKRIILGAFKRYNANTKDINKGDCTVRAMSLAYGIEYESVYKELKQIQKEHGRTFYNTRPTLIDFIDRHGGSQITLNESVTVEEFSERYNSGTYLLLTSKTTESRTHHMVVSIDGDIRTKIYDWMYNIRKDLEDSKKSESVLRDDFYGDRIVAVKLPEWSYPFLRYATSDGFSYKFEAAIDALDGDPRKSEAPSVRFYADSLRELKQQFANYKADFSRYGYDY